MPKKIKKSSTKHLASQILEYNNLSTDAEGKNRKHYREVVNETIEEFLSREDQAEYYDALFNSFIENGIRYPDILHFYIRLFLGIYIPRKNFCRDHKAPFTFICDMFFEEVRNSIAFANRIGGKTTNMAILNHLDMAFKPGCEIASAGAIKEQAQKCYTYFVGFHNRNDYLAELIMPHKPPTMKKTFYANGGFLEVITGTIAGFNSPHPHKVRIDEVELMAWDVLQEGLSMVMTTESHATRKDIMAQNVLSSTRKSEAGTMQRLLEKATKEKRKVGGYKIYKWCIWEVLEKCDRKCEKDEYYGTCGALEVCKGRAKNCEGYFKIDDFIDKVTMLDKDTWEAQWECKRPSRELFVYGKYWNKDKHILRRPQKTEEKTDKHFVEDPYYIGAIDFGSSPGHPFVYKEYLLDVEKFKKEVEESEYDEMIRSKITFYVSYEYRSGGDTMEAHAEKIKASPNYSPYMPIFADPSAKQSRIDLEELYGVMTLEADNAVIDGIDKVRAHLQFAGNRAHFYMLDDYLDCDEVELVGSDVEFAQYKFKRTQDGKVNQKEPMKMDDHGMDCDRYAISSAIPYLREEFQPLWEESTGGFWS